jgi:hypothetical protein
MIILLFLFYAIVICSGTCSLSSTEGFLFSSELLFDCEVTSLENQAQQKKFGTHLQEGVEQFISRIQFPQHSTHQRCFQIPFFEYLIERN